MLDLNQIFIERVNGLYAQCTPALYAKQRAVIDKVPLLLLWETAFSSIYIIAGLRCAYQLTTPTYGLC